MELFNEFIMSLLKLSPVIGLLLIAIWYLYRRSTKLEEENKELNKFIREEGIKNTAVLQTVTSTLDKVVDQSDENLDSLKEYISLKFENMKK